MVKNDANQSFTFMTQLFAPEPLSMSLPDRMDKTGSHLVIIFMYVV